MCSSLIGSWSWKCGIMTLKCENYKCLAFNESKMKHLSFILIVLTQITHVWSQTFYVCFYGDILYALQQNNWQQMYTRGAKKCERTVPAASDVTHLDECSEPSAAQQLSSGLVRAGNLKIHSIKLNIRLLPKLRLSESYSSTFATSLQMHFNNFPANEAQLKCCF